MNRERRLPIRRMGVASGRWLRSVQEKGIIGKGLDLLPVHLERDRVSCLDGRTVFESFVRT